MSKKLYTKILGIKTEKPDNYYELLGVNLYEDDPDKIHAAGLAQLKRIREWQLHPDRDTAEFVQTLLNQVSQACTTLEVPEKKSDYDDKLATRTGRKPSPRKKREIHLVFDKDETDTQKMLRVSKNPNLRTCPECKAIASSLAVICVDCGFNFETGQKLKVEIEKQNVVSNLTDVASDLTTGAAGWTSGVANRAGKMVYSLIKLAFKTVLILAILAGIGFGGYFYVFPEVMKMITPDYKYSEDGIGRRPQWEQRIDDSEVWRIYFGYLNNEKRKRPYAEFHVKAERDESRRMNRYEFNVAAFGGVVYRNTLEVAHGGRAPAVETQWGAATDMVRDAAIAAFARVASHDQGALAPICEHASNPQCPERLAYIRILGDLRGNQRQGRNFLQKLIADRGASKEVRNAARRALAKLRH